MFPTLTQYEVLATDRRQRFEAEAARHRFLGARRRHHRAAAVGGTTASAAVPSIPLGRTPSGIDRQAA